MSPYKYCMRDTRIIRTRAVFYRCCQPVPFLVATMMVLAVSPEILFSRNVFHSTARIAWRTKCISVWSSCSEKYQFCQPSSTVGPVPSGDSFSSPGIHWIFLLQGETRFVLRVFSCYPWQNSIAYPTVKSSPLDERAPGHRKLLSAPGHRKPTVR